jgi:hypothetical protein
LIHVWVGYDEREAVGFPVLCHSVLSRTKAEVAFHPVRGNKVIGSTKFNAGRFEVAKKSGYRGWHVWCESDMLFLADIEELISLADPYCGAMVVKHNYKTKFPTKFLGASNPDYERKNWTSLMLINATNMAWQRIETGYSDRSGQPWTLQDMHRLRFLEEDRIGELPVEWNHLVSEYAPNPKAKLAHYTIGLPIWPEYKDCEFADQWRADRAAMLSFQGAECAQAA